MTPVPPIVCYGASGMSVAIANFFAQGSRPICEFVAFIDDTRGGQGLRVGAAPVISFEEWAASWRDLPCFVGVADPKDRRCLVERISAAGGHFPRLYEPPELTIDGVAIGADSGVGPSTCLNPPDITIGDHVHILSMCSIGHDVRIEDFATICPGATISGYVVIEKGAFIGAGSTVVNGTARRPLVIGAGAKVSAGSVVTKSVPAAAAVAGNPARSLRELARAHGRAFGAEFKGWAPSR